ncbi:MAG: S41 family peptidase, partial [Oscillospiraceae bacterium]
LLNRWVNNLKFGVTDEYPEEMYDCNNGQYYKYTFKHELNGNSSLNYSDDREVYYIVNNSTCSAADEIAQIVKTCGLGKIVGTHTQGEGLIFGVCCDWLPNSLLMYMYCPTYVIDSEGVNNNLYGTMPDIYGGTTLSGYILSDEMEIEGEDWQSLENRELWDNNYRLILAEAGELDAAA